MAEFTNWDEVAERTVFAGFHGRFVHSGRMSFVRWRIEAGAVLPPHRHMHEQVVHTYAGELELVVEGVMYRLTAGTVLTIPPEAEHWGKAITACDVMDAFAPVREDYRQAGDQTPGWRRPRNRSGTRRLTL